MLLLLALLVQDTVTVPHDTLTIQSRAVSEARLINVHLPQGYQASSGPRYPVLYMPDGGMDEDFPHIVHAVDSLISAGKIRPVIVVGIPNTERRRDMTGPTRFKSDSAIAKRVGGSAAFRAFIKDELIPLINKRYRTTDERGIIGESLAGLFIMETLLLEPTMFTHYVALDPSLWWNGNALTDSTFATARLKTFDHSPRTLFVSTANVEEITATTVRLLDLVGRVGVEGLTMVYQPRPDLTHATIFRGVEVRALSWSLK